jgi:hypothetical protein
MYSTRFRCAKFSSLFVGYITFQATRTYPHILDLKKLNWNKRSSLFIRSETFQVPQTYPHILCLKRLSLNKHSSLLVRGRTFQVPETYSHILDLKRLSWNKHSSLLVRGDFSSWNKFRRAKHSSLFVRSVSDKDQVIYRWLEFESNGFYFQGFKVVKQKEGKKFSLLKKKKKWNSLKNDQPMIS